MVWHLTTIGEGLRAYQSCGDAPGRARHTLPLGAPPLLPETLAGHLQQSLLTSFPAYSVSTSVSTFLSNSSPFLLLFAKMCCLQPLKPNYITLIGVLCRKKTFPPRTSQSCSQAYKHYIRKGMMHTGFPNPIWPGKTSSGNKYNINILKSKFLESGSGCSIQGKESIHQNHSAPLVTTPLLLGYPVLWELKGVGWGLKTGPKHHCQQVQPHLQVNKPMSALRLSQKLNYPRLNWSFKSEKGGMANQTSEQSQPE